MPPVSEVGVTQARLLHPPAYRSPCFGAENQVRTKPPFKRWRVMPRSGCARAIATEAFIEVFLEGCPEAQTLQQYATRFCHLLETRQADDFPSGWRKLRPAGF